MFLILAFGLCMFSTITKATEASAEVNVAPAEEVVFSDLTLEGDPCIALAIIAEVAACGAVLCDDDVYWAVYFACKNMDEILE
ncbi:hypothetical protein [Dokdonia sp.]|uniref:hypothetical protein n=1 Tax=Dokdonia sp. TaxID=2024995 RepID=UPI003265DD49